MSMPFKLMIMTVALGLTTACATPPPRGAPPNYYTTGDALMGAAAGAAVGHAIDPTGGALTGALGGALIGGAVGNQMDYQEQRIRRLRRQRAYDPGPPPGYYRRYGRSPAYYDNPPPY
jgi:surface antigen